MTMGDRIAVMNGGLLEQVGTPRELYDRPANRFVAGFIGSPAMSFFDATATEEGGGVRLRGAGVDVLLANAGAVRGDVVVGVRPEAARLWNGERDDLSGPLRGRVAYVEELGRESFVGIDVEGARVVVYAEGRADLLPGAAVEFGLIAHGLAYFSPATGAALTGGPASARSSASA
jgi:ABC-type sugar transport system ATPase subunit